MQRKDDTQLLSNVSALLLVSIILVSLGYFHSHIGFLVYGQNTINNNMVVDTNRSINDRDITDSTKVFEPTANPTVGAIITFTNPTSEPQNNNTTTVDSDNKLNNTTNNTVTIPNPVTNTNPGSSFPTVSS
jgi:hypothetical protein